MSVYSCIVPARNEAGRLRSLIQEIMSIQLIMQIVIVEGGSSDNTLDIARELEGIYPDFIKTIQQSKSGKFNAVLEGASFCDQDQIIIWDADGTVPWQSNQILLQSATKYKVSVIGNRLKGKMEIGAMRRANFIANWVFAFLWWPYHGMFAADMLCGTKIFPKEVFIKMPKKWTLMDPYGDFALVANAIRLDYKIKSIPVNYNARTYGETNIHRWVGGIQLLKITSYLYLRKFLRFKFD